MACAETGCEAEKSRIADTSVLFKERIAMANDVCLFGSLHIKRPSISLAFTAGFRYFVPIWSDVAADQSDVRRSAEVREEATG